MLRRNHILTTAALLAVCATPASAATYEDLRSDGAGSTSAELMPPPSSIAASAADEYQDLRSADAKDAALRGSRASYGPEEKYVLDRGFASPDAADRARDLPPAQVPAEGAPGPFRDSERTLVESPEVQQMLHDISREIRPVVEVRGPSGGFDWGDASIGAAGMLGLFSIAAGSALLLTARKRRHSVQVAAR
jgi:hypothetical protein